VNQPRSRLSRRGQEKTYERKKKQRQSLWSFPPWLSPQMVLYSQEVVKTMIGLLPMPPENVQLSITQRINREKVTQPRRSQTHKTVAKTEKINKIKKKCKKDILYEISGGRTEKKGKWRTGRNTSTRPKKEGEPVHQKKKKGKPGSKEKKTPEGGGKHFLRYFH